MANPVGEDSKPLSLRFSVIQSGLLLPLALLINDRPLTGQGGKITREGMN